MTAKERAYIETKIKRYRQWAVEEATEAKRTTDLDERMHCRRQQELNERAADTLELLLDELKEMS